MYTSPVTWIAILLAGFLGCLATSFALQIIAKINWKVLAFNPGKQLWSFLFAIPMPFLLSIGTLITGLVAAYWFLSLAPSIASKLYFGPKEAKFSQLMLFNSIYAVVAIAVYSVVTRVL